LLRGAAIARISQPFIREGLTLAINLGVYPNPTTGRFKLGIDTKENRRLIIVIYDAGGVVVQRIEEEKKNNVYQRDFNLQQLSKGCYYVRVTVGSFSSVKTIVVQ
jgi:hypothetical protein